MSEKTCWKIDADLIANGFIESFDHVLADCDGVLWIGNDAIPGAPETITALHNMGKKIIYVTNNSTSDRSSYIKKCEKLGFPAELDNIYCTSYCAAVYLQSINFRKKVYIFGGPGIGKELDIAGIEHHPVGPDPVPQDWQKYVKDLTLDPEVGAVVCGFDEHISFTKVLKASSYLKNPECLFIATNKDEQFPTDRNLIIPGSGSYIACIETASARKAISLGKPSKFMFDCIKAKHPNIDPKRCLMIGDRLNTDIVLGTSNGLQSLLVLTGISSLEEVRNYEKSTNEDELLMVPDYYLPSLGDLGKLLNVC